MAEQKKSDDSEEKKKGDEQNKGTDTEETSEEETVEEESDESDSDDSNTDNESDEDDIDYDAELEKEKKKGKPDSKKAVDAFQKRKEKRETDHEEDDEDRPLTRKDIEAIRIETRREAQRDRAAEIARSLAPKNSKEADLIMAKWENRAFPDSVPLSEQIQEIYGGIHFKRISGTNNELKRALFNKGRVNKDGSSTHQEEGATFKGAPKMPAADLQAITAAGFKYNPTSRRYEKTLKSGKTLVKDPRSGKVHLI